MRRLHDDRHCDAALAHPAEYAHAVEIGHDEIQNQDADRGLVRRVQPRHRRLAAVDRFHIVAEPAHHGIEQAPLDWIVVGNQDKRIHLTSDTPGGPNRTAVHFAHHLGPSG